MSKSPLKQTVANTESVTPKYEIQGIVGEDKPKPKMDKYAETYHEMARMGFSDAQKTYVLANMKQKDAIEAREKMEKERLARS